VLANRFNQPAPAESRENIPRLPDFSQGASRLSTQVQGVVKKPDDPRARQAWIYIPFARGKTTASPLPTPLPDARRPNPADVQAAALSTPASLRDAHVLQQQLQARVVHGSTCNCCSRACSRSLHAEATPARPAGVPDRAQHRGVMFGGHSLSGLAGIDGKMNLRPAAQSSPPSNRVFINAQIKPCG